MIGRLSREASVWLVLLIATMLNYSLMESGRRAGEHVTRLLGTAMLMIAFGKAWLVIMNFMEVRGAPTLLRLAMAVWTIAACLTLIGQLWF